MGPVPPGGSSAELKDFATRELEFEVDETLFRDASRLLLRGHIEHKGTPVALEIIYPDLFPYFRPEVYAPQLRLGRHQNPVFGKPVPARSAKHRLEAARHGRLADRQAGPAAALAAGSRP